MLATGKPAAPFAELFEGLRQRQPDDREQCFARRNHHAVRPVALVHRGENHVLAVDERAVAVKYY